MSLTKKIALHTGFQIGGKGIGTMLSIATVYFLTRYLGPEGYGQYTTALSFLQFFGIIVDFGLYVVLLNRLAKPRANREKLVSNTFTLRLLTAVVFLGLAPVIALLFPYDTIVKEGIALMSAFFLFITLNQLLSAVFQKHLAMHWVALGEITAKVVMFGGILAVVFLDVGLPWVFATTLISGAFNFAINFLGARKFEKIRFRFDFPLWKSIIKEAAPIAISISLNLVYFKSDIIFLSLYHSQALVGIYGAPYKILEVLIAFPAMFVGLVIPLLSSAWASKDLERFKGVLQKSVNFLMLLALPIVAGIFVTAEPIMLFIGGEEFIESAKYLRMLSVAAGSIFVGTLFSYLVVVLEQQKRMVWGYAFVAALTFAGYLIFIPQYGATAAAALTIFSEMTIMFIAYAIVLLSSNIRVNWRPAVKMAIAAGAMALIVDTVPIDNLFVLVAIGGVSYVTLVYFLKAIDKETLQQFLPAKK